MSKIRATFLLSLGLSALLSVPALAAEWDHRVNYEQKGIEGKVSETLTQATVAPEDMSGPVLLCAGFGHSFAQTEQGRLKVEFTIFRTDPATGDTTTQTIKKRGRVKASRWLRCAEIDSLSKEDIVLAEWEILDMPKGRGGDIQATVHMSDSRLRLEDLISRGASSSAQAEWGHRVNSEQQEIIGAVPKALIQATAVPADTAARVNLCAGFGHTFKKRERGVLRVRFSVFRTDPETGKTKRTRTRIRGEITKSQWVGCLKVDRLHKDDVVVAEWEILGMPRGRGGEIQAVTHIGDGKLKSSELISRPPDVVEDPKDDDGGTDTTPPPPTDTNGVSGADQKAVSAMSKMTAISVSVRRNGDNRAFRIAHRYNCTNNMEASTIAGAYDKFVNACGRRATGTSLTKSEIESIAKLMGMKHITGIRWESGGTVWGEYWSQSTGTRNKATSSIKAAVKWLVSEGRTVGDEGGGGGGDDGGDPDPPPPPPPPTDTGQVTAAEQKVFSALGKMTAIGIGTRDNGTITWLIAHRYNCPNYQQTATIPGVYAQFVKDCGARATGGALTSSQIAAVAKFKRAFGITGLRWESGGRVIGEYYTPAAGIVHKTFKTIEAAVKWLEKQGRFR